MAEEWKGIIQIMNDHTHGQEFKPSANEEVSSGVATPVSHDPLMERWPDAALWTVSRMRHDYRRIFIRPDGSVGISRWIADVRKCLPLLNGFTPAALLESARDTGGIDLGVLSGREAHHVTGLLERSASVIDVSDASFTAYFPKVDGSGVIIEDSAEAEMFCLRLIELGARVEEIEG